MNNALEYRPFPDNLRKQWTSACEAERANAAQNGLPCWSSDTDHYRGVFFGPWSRERILRHSELDRPVVVHADNTVSSDWTSSR